MKNNILKVEGERWEWEKDNVGKNIHSVYVYCLKCGGWGVNMPLDKMCGNCNSDETITYYDAETVNNLLKSHQSHLLSTLGRRIEKEIIGEDEKKSKNVVGEDEVISRVRNAVDTYTEGQNNLRGKQRQALTALLSSMEETK